MPKLRIAVNMGATVQVSKGQMSDFLKPSVEAELTFDSVPSEEKLKEHWEWLWTTQLAPQYQELLELMMKQNITKP